MKLIDVARIVGGRLYGNKNFLIQNILPPEDATEKDLSFIFDEKLKTRAGAIISQKKLGRNNIVVEDCRRAMYDLLKKISKAVMKKSVSPLVVIDKGIKLPEFCVIEPYAVIKKNVSLGKNLYIGAGVYIDEGVEIGGNSIIHPGVVIYKRTKIGRFVEIGANTVIGKEGFGYIKLKKYHRIPHIGGVIIENFVEIGGNVVIDRGTIGNTIIGRGTKIDNLVHIAHNVRIGRECLIMGQVGIAGSTRIGDRTILCGQVGVSDHLKLGDDVIVYAKSGVFKDLNSKGEYSGIPARPHHLVLKLLAHMYRQIK